MDRNLLLAMALSFAVITLWGMYSDEIKPPVVPEATQTTESQTPAPSGLEAVPAAPTELMSEPTSEAAGAPEELVFTPMDEQRVVIRTDLYEAEFTSHGGALLRWDLLKYDDSSEPGRPAVAMVMRGEGDVPGLATPLKDLGYGDLSRLPFTLEQPDPYVLQFSADVRGAEIRKRYELDPNGYGIGLTIEVVNGTDRHLRPTFEVIWPSRARESADFTEFNLAAFTDDSLELYPVVAPPSFLGFGGGVPEEPVEYVGDVSWSGSQMRYFLAAIAPEDPRVANTRFSPVDPEVEARVQVNLAAADVPPGERLERRYEVYLGPKEPSRLDSAGHNLDEAILKGWFPPLTRFFTSMLEVAYGFVPNYGVAIILITIVVRLLMAPLMTRQMKTMKRMGALQPQMKEIQAQYADDRQKQSEAMMALYKENGMSPFSMFSGCFPMLLQMPVFIGFYYALQGAIQLRQQPFFGWIDDLSQPESLFVIPGLDLPIRVLPILMGGSMVLQQRLSPTTMDPAQARMMMTVMPVMFTVLFYQFASGLVLYWLMSTLLGIGQQMLTNRRAD
jgi:YidC/Oxa1 family membrane protein insertase